VNDGNSDANVLLSNSFEQLKLFGGPVALLVSSKMFKNYQSHKIEVNNYQMVREIAINYIINKFTENSIFVTTTGMISREFYENIEKNSNKLENYFLTVGSMGHSSSIALGIATVQKDKKILCIDGDGALLMHMGSMPIIGQSNSKNFIHIVINNGSHDSVGGQPTCAFNINLVEIARYCGYKLVLNVSDMYELDNAIKQSLNTDGPIFIELRVSKGARSNLKRPHFSPIQNKDFLIKHLNIN
jgi:phosphonopyruvate decarboxylase